MGAAKPLGFTQGSDGMDGGRLPEDGRLQQKERLQSDHQLVRLPATPGSSKTTTRCHPRRFFTSLKYLGLLRYIM